MKQEQLGIKINKVGTPKKSNEQKILEYVALHIAELDLMEARKCLDLLKKVKSTRNRLYHPLATAFVVNYCRPFYRNKLIGKIPIQRFQLPLMVRDSHYKILHWRNKIVAHDDGDHIGLSVNMDEDNNINEVGISQHRHWFVLENIPMFKILITSLRVIIEKEIKNREKSVKICIRERGKDVTIPIAKLAHSLK